MIHGGTPFDELLAEEELNEKKQNDWKIGGLR